jgi:hypothetical protein
LRREIGAVLGAGRQDAAIDQPALVRHPRRVRTRTTRSESFPRSSEPPHLVVPNRPIAAPDHRRIPRDHRANDIGGIGPGNTLLSRVPLTDLGADLLVIGAHGSRVRELLLAAWSE